MPTASRSAAADRRESRAGERRLRDLRHLRTIAAVPLAVAVLAPSGVLEDGPPICLFRRATGRPCPTCGLTRSWSATSRLRFGRAFRHHPFGPPTFVVAALLALGVRPPDVSRRATAALGVPLVAAWLAAWVRRLLAAPS